MNSFKIKLLDKKKVAENTLRFEFEKPAGFSFRAGQCADFTVISPKYEDDRGSTRSFTISSGPNEKNIAITVRMRESGFKKSLSQLQIGETVEMVGPFGSFTLHQNLNRPAVFIAGGIGITPFISILRDTFQKNEKRQIVMFYSSRKLEDAVFLQECSEYVAERSGFQFIPTLTAPNQKTWTGFVGRIDKNLISKNVDLKSNPIFYISGSIPFVNANREILLSLGASDDDIRTDEFPGY